jgi:hypothetical protein
MRFVLVQLIWDEDDDDPTLPQYQRTSNFVESQLSLVSYEVLRIMEPADEATLRGKLIWESDAAIPKVVTNAGVIASNLMGTPISATGDYVVHQGNVSFVSYESNNAEPGGSPEQREKLERMIHEERLRNQGVATPVAGDDMEVDDVGDTHVPSATFVTPKVQNTRLPSGANLPQGSDDMAWGTSGGETYEQTIIMVELISIVQNNCDNMNPVDVRSLRRMLERNASNLDAPSTVALRVLQPIFDKIPENLQICSSCNLGVSPGVQMCPR